MADYRDRLLPFIARWTAEGTRVAVFGIGPHTEFLFDKVPELAASNLVGYLDNNPRLRGKEYRGRTVHPPDWADGNADVVLCSSFISEPAMAASVEHLRCKIVMSHTLPDTVPAAQGSAAEYVFRPEPAAAMIAWPPFRGVPENAQKAIGVARGWESCAARYLGSTAVLDAILEQYYPFIQPGERDVARAIVRYVRAGTRVVQVGGRSEGVGLLLAACPLPDGRFISLMPHYPLGSFIPALQSRCGLEHCEFVLTPESFRMQEYQSHPFVKRLPADTANGTTGHPREVESSNRRSAVEHILSAIHPRGGELFLHIESPALTETIIPRLQALLEGSDAAALLRVRRDPHGGPDPMVPDMLVSVGYECLTCEAAPLQFPRAAFGWDEPIGEIDILAVRRG